jgi:hypothetical protein
MLLAKKEKVLLSAYHLNFNFPAMPPPAPLVVNGQVLYPPPTTSPIKRPRDQFSLSSDDEVAPKKVVQVAVTPKKPAAKVAQLPQAAVVQVAVTPKKPTAKVAQLPEAAVDSPPKKVAQVAVTPKKPAAKVAQLPQSAAVDSPPKKVAQVAMTPKKPAAKGAQLPQSADDADEGSFSSETCSNSCESAEDNGSEDEGVVVVKAEEGQKTQKMAKISLEERNLVLDWCAKERKDKKMNNARWIRNGGAKGSSMTATSGEVRTSGAYEALTT